MGNIRVLVVDDEQPARTRILDLLGKQPDVEIAGVGRDGREAVHLIRQHKPDLLFLDIQMPGIGGLEVLKAIAPEAAPPTIFITGFDQYAIQAFEANALDYLLKPFSDERFEAAMDRGRKHLLNREVGELGKRFARLLDNQMTDRPAPWAAQPAPWPTQWIDRLLLKSSGRLIFLDVDDIDWIEAAGVYVNLHVGAKAHLYRATVGQLQERLNPQKFVRVHRSTIVNTTRIAELQPRTHGDYAVILKSGVEVSLSRGYRSDFEGWLRQSL